MRVDKLMNGEVSCKCSKNHSVVVTLDVWVTHEEEDMVSVLKEFVMYARGNRKQDKAGNSQVVWLWKLEKGPEFRWLEYNPICGCVFMKVGKCVLCEMR